MFRILNFQCYGVYFQPTLESYHAFSFSNFLIVPSVREKIKVILALAIPTGAPTTLVDKMIQTPQLAALKTIKILSM